MPPKGSPLASAVSFPAVGETAQRDPSDNGQNFLGPLSPCGAHHLMAEPHVLHLFPQSPVAPCVEWNLPDLSGGSAGAAIIAGTLGCPPPS